MCLPVDCKGILGTDNRMYLLDINRITPESMEAHLHHLRGLIETHVRETGSGMGNEILDDFRSYLPRFWLVKPKAADLETLMESLRQAA